MAIWKTKIEYLLLSEVEYDMSHFEGCWFLNRSFCPPKFLPEPLKIKVARHLNVSPEALGASDTNSCPSETPYNFSRWSSLILKSRKLAPKDLQTISLSRRQAKYLLEAMNASIPKGRLNVHHIEDLEEHFEPLVQKLDFRPPHGLWVRLDACSPKDGGVHGHQMPGALHCAKDIIDRLVTSTRVRNTIQNYLLDTEKPQGDSTSSSSHAVSDDTINLYFLPFDSRMRSENEYRVFCSPEDLKIRGISQYRWHQRWKYADASQRKKALVIHYVKFGAQAIRNNIVETLRKRKAKSSQESKDLDQLVWRQGVVFDLLFDEETTACHLIELNVFGATGPCGPCLFSWTWDWEQIYGTGDVSSVDEEDEKREVCFRLVF